LADIEWANFKLALRKVLGVTGGKLETLQNLVQLGTGIDIDRGISPLDRIGW